MQIISAALSQELHDKNTIIQKTTCSFEQLQATMKLNKPMEQQLAQGALSAGVGREGDRLDTSTTADTSKETPHDRDRNAIDHAHHG